MSRPSLLLMDEPSMGLAPVLVETIFETIERINSEGTTILLVEQNAHDGAAPSPAAATCCNRAASCSATMPPA